MFLTFKALKGFWCQADQFACFAAVSHAQLWQSYLPIAASYYSEAWFQCLGFEVLFQSIGADINITKDPIYYSTLDITHNQPEIILNTYMYSVSPSKIFSRDK